MTKTAISRLHNLIWVLIYGGLLSIVASLFVARTDDTLACWMASGGAVLVAAGAALIYFRSKLKDVP